MGFPGVIAVESLNRQDFYRFELQFIRSVLDLFPCQTVQFVTEGLDDGEGATLPTELSEVARLGVTLVRQGRRPVVDAEARLLSLPIWSGSELVAVALLSGGGADLYGGLSEEWLVERGRLLSREFVQLKRWALDPFSGLLNATHLRTELQMMLGLADSPASVAPWHLFLIEVAMRAQDAGQAMENIAATAAYLDSLLGDHAVVHHLGVGVFALVWHGEERDEVQRLGQTLLRKLKRQGTRMVHIGMAPFAVAIPGEAAGTGSDRAELLLDRAWAALATARRRGAYAMSVAADDSAAQQHLLAPIAPPLLARLKRLWQGQNQFSIVFVQKDLTDREEFPHRLTALAGEGVELLSVDNQRALVYLPGLDEDDAADWAGAFANRIMPLGIGTFSMGVASYPCPGFRKIDIPMNAKKALVHTQFFGAGTITSFSGVSLNISGDVFYNEGDLAGAIREYRLGLNLTPDNVNLLNSLGVIYAQIDNYAQAIPLFEKAMRLNGNDFMAVFNLGFAHLCQGAADKALACFEQAERIDDSSFDLLLQLGQLYCQRAQYKAAVRVLTKAEKQVARHTEAGDGRAPREASESGAGARGELGHGQVYRALGEAYLGIGKNREAMTYLQRAARYNSRDSEALSLLGALYAEEKQGLDIALVFCRQAVEIDSGKAPYWYRLAEVLHCREEWPEAQEAVSRCLALDASHLEALMLKAAIHERLQQTQLARVTYEKVLRLDGTHARAAKALKKINQTGRSA